MRAIQFADTGQPEDVLEVNDIPVPKLKRGQVLVRMTHRPINPSDLLYVRGLYGFKPRLPATPGFEGCGHVESWGEGVEGLEEDQRVVTGGVMGTWQEYATAQPRQLIPIPDEVNDATAAQFLVNPVTAWVMVTQELGLADGQWLLQTAAGSTVGRLIIQLSKLQGFKTVNLVRRQAQIQELLDYGADAVILTEDKDALDKILQVTKGQGVHAAIDAVGGWTGAIAAKSLRPGGTMLVYGLLSEERTPIDTGDLIFKGSTLRGFWLTQWMQKTSQPEVQETMATIMGFLSEGKLDLPVEAEYDLSSIRDAVIHATQSGRSGKILLTG
ncbi:MAG TPA: zinc-dependent alcohol dehydrogenase family protein [Candidatus Lokiarchaeia archaeon]|nr:zinc-dependent alcohol dehydrogenase family protein [Candidatus Lokiarchaeia archaeon]